MATAQAHIVPANGLTILVEPEVASIDIVFIHGFTGHPERTWLQQSPYTHQKQASSGTKNVRSSRFQGILDSLKGRPKNNVCWPRDLLPTILPDARVLTYGYDTRISHPFGPQRSQSGVYAIARDFLFELEGRRQPPGRPIIFVVHSLGGIVVKQLLKASSQSLDERAFLKDIYDSTAGVLFFGTPHAGADPRGLAHHVVQSIARAMRISANSQVLDTLLPSSERLEELRDHFKPMAIRQNWLIYSFQEALPVQLLGKKVVEDVSSCLDIPQEIRQHIHANHMEMCRFNELEDSQFQKVKHALRRLAEAALARTRATSPGPSMESDAADLTEEQKKVLIQSLAFEQLDARQGNWLDSDKFDRHYGFLWIQGKPGVGKSTIMKFLCTEMKNSSESVKIIITFFFNASGDDLERSTLGMYRSLLLQLLDEIPPLWAIFNHVYRLRWRTAERHCWDVGILQELLEAAVEHLENHSVTFFIDALDECKDSDVHDMIDFMRRMSQKSILFGSQVRTCFSSRHYPIITLERGIEVVLENQSGHAEDIKEYIEAKLKLGYPEIIALVLEASKSARHDSIHGRVDAPDHAEEHQECEELAELLVKNSDHDFSTSNMSALAYYATKGSDVMVEALLRSGAEADAVPWRGLSPLTCGIEGGHSGVVRLLVNAGASAIASSRFDQAPLALTASLGHDMISADLLSAGAEVNHKSIDGRTALSYAAENGHHAIAIQLSQRGADLNHESAYGRNALSYAAENGHETIVDLLLVEHVHDPISGADATAQHSNCPQLVPSRQCASTELRKLLTPLHYASAACHSGIVERLLKRGADVESRNAWSQTPLVFTAAAGHANFDVLCLAIGSTQMSSPQDTTPFPPADSIGFAHASAPEMDSGTVPGGDAVTLETEAIRSGRLHTVELLLLHGALIDSADYDGHTAVAWAAARGDTEMLNFSSREARRLM
ncbi:Ankyrin repeat domain-containing protein 50 like [Verticillium longisporum]|nr:Ankyrin repeat domain-containing protein 50 like [Verticillium longisporum]